MNKEDIQEKILEEGLLQDVEKELAILYKRIEGSVDASSNDIYDAIDAEIHVVLEMYKEEDE